MGRNILVFYTVVSATIKFTNVPPLKYVAMSLYQIIEVHVERPRHHNTCCTCTGPSFVPNEQQSIHWVMGNRQVQCGQYIISPMQRFLTYKSHIWFALYKLDYSVGSCVRVSDWNWRTSSALVVVSFSSRTWGLPRQSSASQRQSVADLHQRLGLADLSSWSLGRRDQTHVYLEISGVPCDTQQDSMEELRGEKAVMIN